MRILFKYKGKEYTIEKKDGILIIRQVLFWNNGIAFLFGQVSDSRLQKLIEQKLGPNFFPA